MSGVTRDEYLAVKVKVEALMFGLVSPPLRIEEIVRKAHGSPKKRTQGDITKDLEELDACEYVERFWQGAMHTTAPMSRGARSASALSEP
jgi:hypothetical protein